MISGLLRQCLKLIAGSRFSPREIRNLTSSSLIKTDFPAFRGIHTTGNLSSTNFKMSEITLVSNNKCFGGWQKVFSHDSSELKCKMNFGIYLPPQAEFESLPVIYWLSGLTCTEQNFITKSGAQRYASEHRVVLVIPDTSPRGEDVPNDKADDLGQGAGFYLDATQEPWKNNYRMYSYITKELPSLVNSNFPVIPSRQSIMGHSMGGHGALICALKNPGMYTTVSAFAPIGNPIESAWGKKAFSSYLGDDEESWKEWDATHLVKSYSGPPLSILIDQGKADGFISQLLPDNLLSAFKDAGVTLILRMQESYDHSYFFVSTFMDDHVRHHVKYLEN
ncbi:S-formylglutathione hydrolase [Fopius arisanus]|uniref:S-formylglutathione hydrolase n=2 Tax=Fopius arisanus TaxID=64838 RepID=A0A9R1TPA7_9HYME|nr:PREDICTED: S-formylglutathione hydrolase [Fopius arisanus]